MQRKKMNSPKQTSLLGLHYSFLLNAKHVFLQMAVVLSSPVNETNQMTLFIV